MPRWLANLVLLGAGATWGLGFVAQATAMDTLGPLAFVASRFIVAAIVVLPLALRESRRAPRALRAREWGIFTVVGTVVFIGMSFQQVGLLTTSVTNSGFITGLYVVLVPIFGILAFREWPSPIVWPCVAACALGIYLLSGASLANLTTGDLLTLVCAAAWAVQVLLIGRYAKDSGRPFTLAATQFATCAALALVAASVVEGLDWQALVATWPEILFAGIFASAIAFTCQIIGQSHTTTAQAAIFLSSEAVFAALLGALILGDRIGFVGVVGAGLLLAAMLTVELWPIWRARRRGAATPPPGRGPAAGVAEAP